MADAKKLCRSRDNKIVAGVCGGIAEYTDIDVHVLRIGLTILVLASGVFPGVIGYLLAMIFIPKEPASAHVD